MGGEHIADTVWAVRQQPLDRAAIRIGIMDALALDCEPPGLIEGILAIGGILAGEFHRLHEQRAGIGGILQQCSPVPVDIGVEIVVDPIALDWIYLQRPASNTSPMSISGGGPLSHAL
jgi:hypothetical protein